LKPITITLGEAIVVGDDEPRGDAGVTLAEARDKAQDAAKQMLRGIDPRGKKSDAVLTFGLLVDQWLALHMSQRAPRYGAEAKRNIDNHLGHLLDKHAAMVTSEDAINTLDKLALAKKPAAARNTMAAARACYGWAMKRRKVPANPFDNLPLSARPVERERVLTDAETRIIWQAAGELSYPFGPFFKLAMLSLQRREEVAGMCWSEITGDLWRIPGARMKGGKLHEVHLSAAALGVLDTIPHQAGHDFVFSTTGRTSISGFGAAKAKIVRAIGAAIVEPWHLHDFRHTGVTYLAKAGFDSIAVDKLLAHKPGKLSAVARIYQRHDFAEDRARALDVWAAHVTGVADGEKVVQLRAAR
jgi:integrase